MRLLSRVFAILACLSMIPLFVATHLPRVPLFVVIFASTLFMVLVSGRFVPALTLITSSTVPRLRGSFLSLNSSMQALAMGSATLLSSAILGKDANGELTGFGTVGLISCGMTLVAVWWSKKLVKFS